MTRTRSGDQLGGRGTRDVSTELLPLSGTGAPGEQQDDEDEDALTDVLNCHARTDDRQQRDGQAKEDRPAPDAGDIGTSARNQGPAEDDSRNPGCRLVNKAARKRMARDKGTSSTSTAPPRRLGESLADWIRFEDVPVVVLPGVIEVVVAVQRVVDAR